jgi:hypothetical protein
MCYYIGVKGITKLMHEKLDILYTTLINQGFLDESKSEEARFRKIIECLQCKNSINYKNVEYSDNDFGRNVNVRISDLLPFFEDNANENNEPNNNEADCDVSTEKSTSKPYQEIQRPNSWIDKFSQSTINFNTEQSPQGTHIRCIFESIILINFYNKII